MCDRGAACIFVLCERVHPPGWDPSSALAKFLSRDGTATEAQAESAPIPHSAVAVQAAGEATSASADALRCELDNFTASEPTGSEPLPSTAEVGRAAAAAPTGLASSGGAPSSAAASAPLRASRAGACFLCRDGDSCREAACIFVHIGQRCRHGADVAHGELCSFIREKHAAAGRADRAFSCVPCRHGMGCTRGATCFFVHPGQLCKHGGDVLAGHVDKCKRVGAAGPRKGLKPAVGTARGAARGDGPASPASVSDADADADDEADNDGATSEEKRGDRAEARPSPRASVAAGATGGAGAGSPARLEGQLSAAAASAFGSAFVAVSTAAVPAAVSASTRTRPKRLTALTCFACRDGDACRDVDCRHVHDGQLCRHGEDVRAGALCDFIREKHAASGRPVNAANCAPCKYGIACNRACDFVHPGQLCQHGGDVLAGEVDRCTGSRLGHTGVGPQAASGSAAPSEAT